jgi:hypothetical protein
LCHHLGGAHFFVGQFGVGVDVAADLLQFGLELDDGVDEFHGELSS